MKRSAGRSLHLLALGLLQFLVASSARASRKRITTVAGCTCKPSSYEGSTKIGDGCVPEEVVDSKTGWCDVEPGCQGAQERTEDYDGFDACELSEFDVDNSIETIVFKLPSSGPWGINFGVANQPSSGGGLAVIVTTSIEVGGQADVAGILTVSRQYS